MIRALRRSPAERDDGADPKAGAQAPPQKGRDAFFDNAKFLAIVLVVVGHSWESLRDHSRATAAAYMLLYAFHMPAFTIISGYFSRSFDFRPRQLQRLVSGVVVPYITFEVALNAFRAYNTSDPFEVSILDPWYLTWFLMSLFIWRLTAPLWRLMRFPLATAVLIAVVVGTTPTAGDEIALQRTAQYLPFFVLGLQLSEGHFLRLRTGRLRFAAVAVLAAGAAVAYWAVPRMNPDWFYRRDAAQDLGVPTWVGVLMILGMLACSLALSAAFLALVPARRTWFTALGTGTLYAYLLHGFLAKGAHWWDWYDSEWARSPVGIVSISLIAAVIAVALTTPPVRRVFTYVMEPRLDWLFRNRAPGASAPKAPTRPQGAAAG
ncbi:acyltransferase family protein [Streptomyces sp. GC420]|uniref:acyltransferase family protein n=1 Tax=Streptomyces sp. GC420 TaxID=2697568 RepID=UPI0028BD5485|nr:acyltransferase family protein [Streptomyces sp. GC420]